MTLRTITFDDSTHELVMKQQILDTIHDMVQDFLYYDRKEDEEMPVGAIDQAIAKGEISVDEIVEAFKTQLIENIEP